MHHPARDSERAVGFAITIAPRPGRRPSAPAFRFRTMTANGGHDRV
ncbi:hypothetical protein SJ05684_c33120 [Sinorhizobium sojae CCBAU 05684]|uniref:Uncharacterized protein n=1 Tax=Sinorhizobium sojae CCBAU 05684 TaxID=716928 RepID=A0A249PGE1_9HYPH|nr:hypothetical protein SJ05684_c33120 [Sinorhizobium sojae CCBAU 05684]